MICKCFRLSSMEMIIEINFVSVCTRVRCRMSKFMFVVNKLSDGIREITLNFQ